MSGKASVERMRDQNKTDELKSVVRKKKKINCTLMKRKALRVESEMTRKLPQTLGCANVYERRTNFGIEALAI